MSTPESPGFSRGEHVKDNEPRCPTCGMVLGDPGLVARRYCTSECERALWQ